MPLSINVSAVWKQTAEMSVKVSGDWKAVTQAWVNLSGVWKTFFSVIGVWSTGPNMATQRGHLGSSGDAQTSILAIGGFTPYPSRTNTTEKYNGTSWASAGNLVGGSTADNGAGPVGTVAAGLKVGGYTSASVEKYNGTNWSTANNLPSQTYFYATFGLQSAAVAAFGNNAKKTYLFNGTNWSTGNDCIAIRNGAGGLGIQSAGMTLGSNEQQALYKKCEKFNGSVWSTGPDLVSNAYMPGPWGSYTAAVCADDYTEEFDGTTWKSGNNSPVGARCSAAAGQQNSGISCGFGNGTMRCELYSK